MAFLPNTILCQIHFHSCLYPMLIHQYFHAFPTVKSYQSISPSTTRICRFHSYNLIFLFSLCRSPFLTPPFGGRDPHFRACCQLPSKCLLISVRHHTSGFTFQVLLVRYLQVRATLLSLGNQAEPLPTKVPCIPHLSKYFVLPFSFFSSVGAVLKVV